MFRVGVCACVGLEVLQFVREAREEGVVGCVLEEFGVGVTGTSAGCVAVFEWASLAVVGVGGVRVAEVFGVHGFIVPRCS